MTQIEGFCRLLNESVKTHWIRYISVPFSHFPTKPKQKGTVPEMDSPFKSLLKSLRPSYKQDTEYATAITDDLLMFSSTSTIHTPVHQCLCRNA